MNSTKSLSISIIILFSVSVLGSFSQNRQRVSLDTAQIRTASEVIGLEFDKNELEQMQRDVSRQISSYKMIRDYSLPNSVSPALNFVPFPVGIKIPSSEMHPNWEIPVGIELPNNPVDIAYMSINELASLIKNRKISSVYLTKLFLERLKKYDDELLCVVSYTEEYALRMAQKADDEISQGLYRGILHGIPYGVKDLLSFPDYTTTWGAKPFENQMLSETATVIQKLEDAGAILVCKLSLGALAMGDVWFKGTTRNPWNTENGSSGSSAGPAAAVSAGLLPFAIGSETLGSIVSPSTRCSVTGLRPGFGRVSKYGAMALSWSMDKLGPICRSSIDCAIVFDAIIGGDIKDNSVLDTGFEYDDISNLSHLKIGYLANLFAEDYSAKENDQKILQQLKELGANLIEVKLPEEFPVGALRIILSAEAAAAFDELTRSNRDSLLVSQSDWSWPNSFRSSRLIPAVEYINANRIRSLLTEQVNNLFRDYDLIISPSFVGTQLTMTNLTGHPALLIPTGFDDKSNPTSITLLGYHFSEGTLCAVGQLIQDKTMLYRERPPKFN